MPAQNGLPSRPVPSGPPEKRGRRRGPIAALGELAGFLFGRLRAVTGARAPSRRPPDVQIDPEPDPAPPAARATDRLDDLIAKVAPFPAQDG